MGWDSYVRTESYSPPILKSHGKVITRDTSANYCRHWTKDWLVVAAYAGSPILAKSFNDKLRDKLAVMPVPSTAAMIRDVVETELFHLDVLDNDPMSLSLLCGIVIPNSEYKLLKTQGKVVSEVDRFDIVGAGDSSLLKYLAPLMTQTNGFTSRQAANIATYCIRQAKAYVDGCGGDTDAIILQLNGRALNLSAVFAIEQRLAMLEHFLKKVVTDFLDTRRNEEDLKDSVERCVKALKDYRPEINRQSRRISWIQVNMASSPRIQVK